ncbi:MAG: DUF4011 domain-containing protein [Acidobacteria bacterium]|nr:DUF4011 domain-containing protein [Acidobacteriota bacterium]
MSTKANNGNPEPVAAVQLSPEFLQGTTEAGLEKIRTRLLDLTNRNRLLNFRHTVTSSLRVVDADLNDVFRRLLDGEKLAFRPVPEPDADRDQDNEGETNAGEAKPTASEHAQTIGWRTSYDLDNGKGDGDSAVLHVLHYLEELETLTRRIGSAAKTAIEESGTNMLYLILGFLEWYEADDSQQPRLAPLLTVPVTLERAAGKGRGFECSIEYSGEDFTTNLSLAEKMRLDFGVEIPAVEDEDTPAKYLERFSPLLRQRPRWRIRRQITLSLLSFGKLLMYRDLDPNAWPGIARHTLVKELFEGRKSETITHAEEYLIDAPDLKPEVPALILDADSSQHSALIHAMRGQNLVIEGPPGTGKSQTITNLIAAALVSGKAVLFVSEKLAALEVVRRRLDEAGLGLFCLELHSHKTKKHALLNDLAARLKAQGSFREPMGLEQCLAAVDDRKRHLTQYAGLINKPVEPFQATIFEVLWARDRYLHELQFAREPVEHLLLPAALSFTRSKFDEARQFLSEYENRLAGIQRVTTKHGEHPWAWLAKVLTFAEEIKVTDLLTKFSKTLGAAMKLWQSVAETAGLDLNDSIRGLNAAHEFLGKLPQQTGAVNRDFLESCRDIGTRQRLHEFVKAVEAARVLHADLGKATAQGDPRTLLHEEHARRLSLAVEDLKALGLDKHECSRLPDLLAAMREAEKTLSEADQGYAALQALLGSQLAFSTSGVELVLHCLRLIESAPTDVLHLRTASLEADGVSHVVRSAAQEARSLRDRHQELDARFDLALAAEVTDPRTLTEYARAVEDASLWQVWFGRGYRQAKKAHRRMSRTRRKEMREVMGRDFRALSDYAHRRTEFETQSRCRELLEPHFQGVETPWDDLLLLLAWYEDIFTSLPEEGQALRDLLLRVRVARLKSLKASLPEYATHRATLARLQGTLPRIAEDLSLSIARSYALQELLGRLQGINRRIEEAVGAFTAADLRGDMKISEIPAVVNTAASYGACMARLSSNQAVQALLGASFQGTATNLEPLKATLTFAESVSGDFPEKTVRWILCADGLAHTKQLRGNLKDVQKLGDKLGEEIKTLTASTAWPVNTDEPLAVLLGRVDRALKNRDELTPWVHFLRIRAKCKKWGLDRLTNLTDERVLEPQHLLPAFQFVFYNSLSRSVFEEHPDLSQFSGLTQDEVRKTFAADDRKAIALYRERAAAIIDRRRVPYGNQSGPVGTWTELALITKEIHKQKRHIPIRQLVRRSGGALQALKPCFMMGPLSVAQYLAPGQIHFDLIVMDEASQLKPEDSIGAIARGTQIVIVGDPKQLPPTSFFQRVLMDSGEGTDEDALTVVEEGESILDVASTLYQPVRRLRWHYRSRHQSLIAFSNHEFYQGDLVIFPSPFHEDSSLGVKYRPVSGGVFENSRNPREASVVVEAVLSHMKDHPHESLGVVTLNFEQRELVEELLDQKLRTDPFAMAYQERMNAGPEPFFIKNLENVQGDERDVIFISVTYGPDARGNQYMRFGPINGSNGHRRLNVLFTRAKKRTEVFSSLDPDKIQVTATSPWGLRALKQYLTFARSGVLETPDEGCGQPSNDFEMAVGAVLKESGFAVVSQVGVAGFFIDLAIRHPAKPGTFILGIECDGASYHSGRSARDRDRLRQEILENLGWKIHRIWSTDWFKSRGTEIKRLFARIEGLLASDPDYLREKQKAHRLDTLRARLVDLRDEEILPAFPDCAPEKCLLRPELLEELIGKRPRSRDHWFRMISHALRSSTDSKQVGQFLDRVLTIIAECDS